MTTRLHDAQVQRILVRCGRKAMAAHDGRGRAGAQREAVNALVALGVEQPLAGRMAQGMLHVADTVRCCMQRHGLSVEALH